MWSTNLTSKLNSLSGGWRALMAVKQGGLKRALASLLLLCALLVLYLYWQQNHELPVFAQHFRSSSGRADDKKDLARWTWNCVNNRCVRKESVKGAEDVPLATCNMMCGSTPQLWPQPTGTVRLGTHASAFQQHQMRLIVHTGNPAYDLVQRAYDLFSTNVAQSKGIPVPEKNAPAMSTKNDIRDFLVIVTVKNESQVTLLLDTDESYNLTVTPSGVSRLIASITAKTFFGARHGLETLSQLIWWDEYTNGGTLKVLRRADIQDAPKFAYRGLMLDTARNFFPVDHIKRTLEGMASTKLNVFHWHISDSQSFPFDVPSVPQLAKYGAYGPDMIYSAQDVKQVVQFAKVLGIRVVIEVDTPAHSGNGWTWGGDANLGQLAVCVNEQPWSVYCGEPPCGQLNPDNPNVYPILENIYRDVIELTGEEEVFHLGGDEVNLECWAQMRRSTMNYNNTDYHTVWGEFTQKAIERLKAANKGKSLRNVILWSSNLSKQPYNLQFLKKEEVVIQTWGASQWPETPDLLNDGYRIIVSHVDAWYLDCGFGRWRENGEAACDPYRTWHQFYNHRPWNFVPAIPDVKKQILGGEVCLWTEQVGKDSLDARIWPRTAAFAERMWADPHSSEGHEYGVAEDVYTRLSTHRSRLQDRGISAEAMWPYWCVQNPGMCL